MNDLIDWLNNDSAPLFGTFQNKNFADIRNNVFGSFMR